MRKRYSFWDALGDIGGFYDGLRLLIWIFMAPITSIIFTNDTVQGSLFAKAHKSNRLNAKKQRKIVC